MFLIKCPICEQENHFSSTEKSRNCSGCNVPLQHGVLQPDDYVNHIPKVYAWSKPVWQQREQFKKQLEAQSRAAELAQPITVVHFPVQAEQIAALKQENAQLDAQFKTQLEESSRLEREVQTKAAAVEQKVREIQRLTDLNEHQANELQDQENKFQDQAKEIQNLCQLNADLASQLKGSQEEASANMLVLRKIYEEVKCQLKTQDLLSESDPIDPESVALERVSVNIADSSEDTPPASVSEATSAVSGRVQPPWLPQYNQDPKSMAGYAMEVLATEDSLHNYWLARERQVIFEPGNGSYWIFWVDETRQTGHLVPKANFRFNANNLDSIKVCFDFPDYSSNDYSNFSVTAPAIVSKIIPATQQQDQPTQWQLDERGWLEFQANNSAGGESSYETS